MSEILHGGPSAAVSDDLSHSFGLVLGVAATVGLGAALGAVLAVVSQSGSPPPWRISELARLILLLLAVMGASAVSAGIIGYKLSTAGLISLPASLAAAIPAQEQDRFMAVWFAHGTSYLTGLVGAGLLCFRVWTARGRPAIISVWPRTRAACLRAAVLAVAVVCVLWFRFASH